MRARAVVICKVEYVGEGPKFWMDRVVLEEGLWKMDPRKVQMLPLTPDPEENDPLA